MPLSIFGFQLFSKTSKSKTEEEKINKETFVSPTKDSDIVIETTTGDSDILGGVTSTYIDFEASAKDERQQIDRYRSMSYDPDVDLAIEDIVNDEPRDEHFTKFSSF